MSFRVPVDDAVGFPELLPVASQNIVSLSDVASASTDGDSVNSPVG